MLTVAPKVSVIVPCRNEAAHIATCVAGLLALEAPAGGFEVIVADGMSDDGTREILKRIEDGRWKMEGGGPTPEVGGQRADDGQQNQQAESRKQRSEDRRSVFSEPAVSGPVMRVIDNPGRIVSMGLNAAIRAARGNIIIRMDAHTEYASDYVCECVKALETTGADNVGGPARTRANTSMQNAVAAAYHSPFAVGGARFHDVNYEGYVDTVTYGCWRRETFEKFGYFDEELVRNQDDEHNLRITRGGRKVYQSPKIRSWYRPRGSLGALFKQYMQYGYWKVRVIQKHKLPASWRHLVPGSFILVLMLLFLLSAFCFLLSAFAPNSQLSILSFPISIFSFQLSAFSFAFLAVLGSYALALMVASAVTAAKTEWKLLPVLPLVFGCYHFGYGFGFLRGILDFVILRRGAAVSFTKLTRASSEPKVTVRRP